MATKPIGLGAGNKLTPADDASGLSGLPAATGLSGQVPQENGGLGVDASALSNGVLVKSGGVMSSTTAPTMSGANISAGTIPTASLDTATQNRLNPTPSAAGRIAYDTGSGWAALTAGAANTILQSNGAAAPLWTSAPTVSGANISAGTIGYGSLATSATDRMLANPALANNLVMVGNGTNWTAVGTASSGYLLTAGATTPVWSTSLSGIVINASNNTVSNIATSMLASGFNLAATQGGTGQTSYTVGDLLYASTTTALSKLAAGTTKYVLTANGAGVAPSYQALPTATTVSTTLTATTWTSTTFADTGQKITLPSGGLWEIEFKIRNYCVVSSGAPGVNSFQLYDNTAAAAITDSQAFGAADYIGGGNGYGLTTTWRVFIDVASGRDIKLYAKRLAGPTYAMGGTGMASDTTEGTSTATAVLLRA